MIGILFSLIVLPLTAVSVGFGVQWMWPGALSQDLGALKALSVIFGPALIAFPIQAIFEGVRMKIRREDDSPRVTGFTSEGGWGNTVKTTPNYHRPSETRALTHLCCGYATISAGYYFMATQKFALLNDSWWTSIFYSLRWTLKLVLVGVGIAGGIH
jgi:hypothetical protein